MEALLGRIMLYVRDVRTTCDGYSFVNAKDPDGNSISISSRAFACR